jgi:hypothetical protein
LVCGPRTLLHGRSPIALSEWGNRYVSRRHNILMFPEAILRLRINKARNGGACWDVACTGRNSELRIHCIKDVSQKKERRRRTEGKGEVRLADSSHLLGHKNIQHAAYYFFAARDDTGGY